MAGSSCRLGQSFCRAWTEGSFNEYSGTSAGGRAGAGCVDFFRRVGLLGLLAEAKARWKDRSREISAERDRELQAMKDNFRRRGKLK